MRALILMGGLTVSSSVCGALSKTIDQRYLGHDVSGFSPASYWVFAVAQVLLYGVTGVFLHRKFGAKAGRGKTVSFPNLGETILVATASFGLLMMLCSVCASASQYRNDLRVPPPATFGFYYIIIALTLTLTVAVIGLIRDLRRVHRQGGWRFVQQMEAARLKEDAES